MEGKGRCNPTGSASGPAMVSAIPLTLLGDIDPGTGMIVRKESPLFGRCVKDAILVFPEARGSTVGSYVLYSLKVNGTAPAGMINVRSDAITVVGAVLAGIPVVDRIRGFDPVTDIHDGDMVVIDGDSVRVEPD